MRERREEILPVPTLTHTLIVSNSFLLYSIVLILLTRTHYLILPLAMLVTRRSLTPFLLTKLIDFP